MRPARAILTLFMVGYAIAFLASMSLEAGPPEWDEAFMLYHPTVVATTLHREGAAAAARAFFETGYHKPPLPMFGTLAVMLFLGDANAVVHLDNLLVVLLGAGLAFSLLSREIGDGPAAASVILLLPSPYLLAFLRSEMAEAYLWSAAVLFLWSLDRSDDFGSLRGALRVGLAFGLGLLSKLSFPLVIGGPAAWRLARVLRAPARGARLLRMMGAGGVAVVVVLPFFWPNASALLGHFMAQFGELAQVYAPAGGCGREFLTGYLSSWLRWFGPVWSAGALLAVGLVAELRRRGLPLRPVLASPAGPLALGFLVNFLYCYNHTIGDMRFTLGSFLCAQLFLAVLAGRGLKLLLPPVPRWAPRAGLLVALGLSLSTEDLDGRLWWTAHAAPYPAALPAVVPSSARADLRDDIIRLLPADGRPLTVALAGDHVHLNAPNLRLRMRQLDRPGDVVQLGYGPLGSAPAERVTRAGDSRLWVVIDAPASCPGVKRPAVSWAQRFQPALAALLRSRPDVFRPLAWNGVLMDGCAVTAFERVAAWQP